MDSRIYVNTLKSLNDNLAADDLIVLKFLCQDIVKVNRLEGVASPLELFDELESAGALSETDLQLLAELLFEAQRIDLMKTIGITPDDLKQLKDKNGHRLNAYRQMLHTLSENMIRSDVKQLKRLMTKTSIPRARLSDAADAYSLFSLLEKQHMITPTDVTQLLKITRDMDEPGLSVIVSSYMDEHRKKSKSTRDISIQCDPTSSLRAPSLRISEYTMKSGPIKGICVVINNEQFDPAEQRGSKAELKGPRVGSGKDCDSLRRTFTDLAFDVHPYKNLKAEQLYSTMKRYAQEDHSAYDIFVCCILTHGEAGKVFGTDCLPVSLHSLLSRFSPRHCKSLENKPKVFFVQACQGGRQSDDSLDSIPFADGVSAGAAASSGDGNEPEDLETDFTGKLSNVTNIPRQPDYLLGLATVPGFVSYRSKSSGSWYIQALCELLSKLHNSADLLSILTEVNNKVLTKQKRNGDIMATQIPLPQHTLRKRIYLRTT